MGIIIRVYLDECLETSEGLIAHQVRIPTCERQATRTRLRTLPINHLHVHVPILTNNQERTCARNIGNQSCTNILYYPDDLGQSGLDTCAVAMPCADGWAAGWWACVRSLGGEYHGV